MWYRILLCLLNILQHTKIVDQVGAQRCSTITCILKQYDRVEVMIRKWQKKEEKREWDQTGGKEDDKRVGDKVMG